MPSSTSNFSIKGTRFASQRSSCVKWGRVWLVAILFATVAVGGWESLLRKRGHVPTVVDNHALWALHRDQLDEGEPNQTIVLLGDCRMQTGFVPKLLQKYVPEAHIVQLAKEGTSPMVTLHDLAEDVSFRGLVLCNITSRELCEDMWETQRTFVDFYHQNYTWNTRLNRTLATYAQERLVYIHPRLRIDDIIARRFYGQGIPDPHYQVMFADRSRLNDYTKVNLAEHQNFTLDRIVRYMLSGDLSLPEDWLVRAMNAEVDVQAIHARGGRVVFLRFPTSGDHLMREEMGFPRDQFWDAFAEKTSAQTYHFQDYPSLAGFQCPDYSHLDRMDAPRFTIALIEILSEDGILPPVEIQAEDRQLPPSPFDPLSQPKPKQRKKALPDDFNPFGDGAEDLDSEDFNPFEPQEGDVSDEFNPLETDSDTLPD